MRDIKYIYKYIHKIYFRIKISTTLFYYLYNTQNFCLLSHFFSTKKKKKEKEYSDIEENYLLYNLTTQQVSYLYGGSLTI